jgi:HTH-type transcriptional regulator / antitoxin HigA
MATSSETWHPDWAVPPGEVLLEALQERGMSQSELARRMGRPYKTINEVINAKAAITPDTAIQLERTLGIGASFWNNLEASYRERLAEQRAKAELEASASWVDAFPIRDLVGHRLLERGQGRAETLAALLRFFAVGSTQVWESEWLAPEASLRSSPTFASSPYAVASWLRWGEIVASGIETAAFDAAQLTTVLRDARGLTRQEPFARSIERVQKMCATAGVAVVVVPELGKTRLSGAAHWLKPRKAIIQLSLRHKSDDQFWFSLYHEAGHLVDRERRDYVDAEDDDAQCATAEEEAANLFARNLLIPPEGYANFVSVGTFTAEAVRAFASEQGIAPGVVVGRLQREHLVRYSSLNELKKGLHWVESA